MLTDIQERWLQALESGNYRQGTGYLKKWDRCNGSGEKESSYCCLGVACEIFQEETNTKQEASDSGIEFLFNDMRSMMPASVMEYLGLRTAFGNLEEKRNCVNYNDSLAEMNDKGVQFKEIAAYIRANPEKVFKNA